MLIASSVRPAPISPEIPRTSPLRKLKLTLSQTLIPSKTGWSTHQFLTSKQTSPTFDARLGNLSVISRPTIAAIIVFSEKSSLLFNKGRSTINEHILNIFKEGELDEKVVCRKFRHTTQHGALEGKTQSKEVKYYNLDVIISVGYRVKSIQGTRFRQWATERLHEYIVKGFTMDDERLKGLGGGNYWKELLDRIRDIRSSEKSIAFTSQ